jgi:ATP-binding protein involved in chromosome partitioning
MGDRGFIEFEARRKLKAVHKVILVGSAKGGVGKSLVACGLGLRLSQSGYRVAIFEVDIHGSSAAGYLGITPPLNSSVRGLAPKKIGKLEVMSVALMTGDNPLPVRGAKKQGLITELFALTDWGELDYLVVDLPPSAGDELLASFELFAGKAILLLVTTPSAGALKVVSRLRRLAESEGVPVAGAVLNMAYERSDGERTFPFGRVNAKSVRRALGAPQLVEVPLDPKVNALGLVRAMNRSSELFEAFNTLSKRVATV